MTPETITAMAGAVGPTAAILIFMWINSRPKEKASDPIKELTEALSSIRERLVRIETRLDLRDKE